MADDPTPDPKPDPTPDPAPDPKPDPDPEPDLGDAGKKALAAERKARRDAEQTLKDLQAKVKEFEDKDKSETQRLNEALTQATAEGETSKAELLKLDVALDKAPEGMSAAQVRKLAKRLHGSTREELESDADELFAEFQTDGKTPPKPNSRPKERLRGGAVPDAEADETDPEKLAALISHGF